MEPDQSLTGLSDIIIFIIITPPCCRVPREHGLLGTEALWNIYETFPNEEKKAEFTVFNFVFVCICACVRCRNLDFSISVTLSVDVLLPS